MEERQKSPACKILDLAEAMGGSAEEAYNEAYAAAKKSGMSDAEADGLSVALAMVSETWVTYT